MDKKKIVDFGEKIGFARKDMMGGFTSDLLAQMNEAEMRKFVRRDGVWPLPNAERHVNSGIPAFVVYWQREVRRLAKAQPIAYQSDTVDSYLERCTEYTDQLNDYRKMIESVTTEAGIEQFYQDMVFHRSFNFDDRFGAILGSPYNLRKSYRNLSRMKAKCQMTGFPFAYRAKNRKRKQNFIPPQLDHIEREGRDYRHGVNIDADRWQKDFNFRGVEFGNWMSQKDRRFSMNYAYDALMDLAYVLDIVDTDIAFGGKLALAFGSRGCSHASAHYEPLREVINLTKMHGAGCTAHEWFHAFDDRLAKWCGITSGELASETTEREKLPKSFVNLVGFLKHDKDGNMTDFYRGSREMDRYYAKDAHGAWSSNAEMLARAFACYVKDTLGCKSDYLIAHADVYEFEYENQSICAIPQGEEREFLNDLFDQLFFDMKEIGFFSPRPIELFSEKEPETIKTNVQPITKAANIHYVATIKESADGQLCFVI